MPAVAQAPAKRHPPPRRPARRLPLRRRSQPRPPLLPRAASTIARPTRHARRRRCGQASAPCGSERLSRRQDIAGGRDTATHEARQKRFCRRARAGHCCCFAVFYFISIYPRFIGVLGIPLQHSGGLFERLDRDYHQQSCSQFILESLVKTGVLGWSFVWAEART